MGRTVRDLANTRITSRSEPSPVNGSRGKGIDQKCQLSTKNVCVNTCKKRGDKLTILVFFQTKSFNLQRKKKRINTLKTPKIRGGGEGGGRRYFLPIFTIFMSDRLRISHNSFFGFFSLHGFHKGLIFNYSITTFFMFE